MNVVLINPYELGRQPFGLAEPAAWLKSAGFSVRCVDLSVESLDRDLLSEAELIAIYVAMHTATRIAVEAIPRIRQWAPRAHLCAYGLYAPVNEQLFRNLGVGTVLGGEVEPGLLALAERVSNPPMGTRRLSHSSISPRFRLLHRIARDYPSLLTMHISCCQMESPRR